MRRLIPSLVAGIAVLAIAAPAASATDTRAQYAIEVNIICQEAEEDYGEAFDLLFKGKQGFGSIVRVFDAIDDIYEQTVRNIAAVPPAPGDEALVGSWIAVMNRIVILSDRSTGLLKKSLRKFKPLYTQLDEDEFTIKPKTKRGRQQLRQMGIRFKRLARKTARAGRVDESLARQLGAEGCVASDGDIPFRFPSGGGA